MPHRTIATASETETGDARRLEDIRTDRKYSGMWVVVEVLSLDRDHAPETGRVLAWSSDDSQAASEAKAALAGRKAKVALFRANVCD